MSDFSSVRGASRIRGRISRAVIISTLLLVILTAATFLVVQKLRKPGSMTVLESQAMDMTVMVPPKGTVPVATEKVKKGSFKAHVTYTGSVVPYLEETVYPRITGRLEEVPVYAGDRVSSGQLVARLDDVEVAAMEEEARHGAEAKAVQATIAKGEEEEARWETEKLKSMLAQSEQKLKAAQADLAYWEREIKREEELLKSGAVSQEEFDREQAQFLSRKAAVLDAKHGVEAAKRELKAAQIRQEIVFKHHFHHFQAEAREAQARLTTRTTIRGYTLIKVSLSGVVTKRLIDPGVLVNPGMGILKIADISRIRLQANVAEADVSRIKVGNSVKAYRMNAPEEAVSAQVTSIFPEANPTARTVVIEALTQNPGNRFVPGEFIVMEIVTTQNASAVSVPSGAVVETDVVGRPFVWTVVSGGKKGEARIYTCVMHPEVQSDKPGKCPKCGMDLVPKETGGEKIAHKVFVKVGSLQAGGPDRRSRTEILKGLKEGDEVITKGHNYLREGDPVYVSEWGRTGPLELPPPPAMEGMPGMEHKGMPGMDHKGHTPQPTATPDVSRVPKGKYYCPMHPEVIRDKPGSCPKCGMNLELKK